MVLRVVHVDKEEKRGEEGRGVVGSRGEGRGVEG